jgi:TolB protein
LRIFAVFIIKKRLVNQAITKGRNIIMKLIAATKLSVILLLITALFTLAGCSKPYESDQTGDVDPVRPDKSTAESPRSNNEAWRGQGRLAFIWQDRLYVLNGDDGTLTRLSDTGLTGKPQWSPDGEWLAYLGDDNKLRIVKADGSRAQEVNGLPSPVHSLDFAWSPNADVLAVTTGVEGEGFYLFQPGKTPRQIPRGNTHIFSFAWSPDGQTIAYADTLPYDKQDPGSRSDALFVAPAYGGKPFRLHVAESAGIILAGWSPDGKEVLFWVTPGHSASLMADGLYLFSLSLAGGKPNQIATTLLYPEWLSWSPDGRKLMAVAGSGREIWHNKYLVVYDAKTGKCTELPRRPGTVTFYPDWSPDGTRISYLQADEREDAGGVDYANWKKTWSLWIADADGANARRLDEAGTGIDYALWSRDGAHIVYLKDNAVWLINANGGSPVRIVDLMPGQKDLQHYYGYTSWADQLAYYR